LKWKCNMEWSKAQIPIIRKMNKCGASTQLGIPRGYRRVRHGDSFTNGGTWQRFRRGVACLNRPHQCQRETLPSSSILIVMVTAEEMGLVGAFYFASYRTGTQSAYRPDVNYRHAHSDCSYAFHRAAMEAEHSADMGNDRNLRAKYLGLRGLEADPGGAKTLCAKRSIQFRCKMHSRLLQSTLATKAIISQLDMTLLSKLGARTNNTTPISRWMDGIFDYCCSQKLMCSLNFLSHYSVAKYIQHDRLREIRRI